MSHTVRTATETGNSDGQSPLSRDSIFQAQAPDYSDGELSADSTCKLKQLNESQNE